MYPRLPQKFFLKTNLSDEIEEATRVLKYHFNYSGCIITIDWAEHLGYKWSKDKVQWYSFSNI